ncbi:Cannabinoid receptor 2 [Exaiptasia diaphana]|nr:Cannabinoid receptor 2 [Exaiptasia diaphana]
MFTFAYLRQHQRSKSARLGQTYLDHLSEKVSFRSNKSTLLLAALAFTDLLVSVTVQPLGIWLFACLIRGCTLPCLFLKVGVPMTALTAMLTSSSLMMVSIEKYLAVEHPFFYSKITIKHVVLSAIVTWMFVLVALVTGALLQSTVGLTPLRAIFLVIMIADVLVTLYCTGKVQLRAHRHMKEIVKRRMAAASLKEATDKHKQDYQRRYQEYKQIMTIGIIVLANFILYFPFIIILILSVTNTLESTGYFRIIAVPLAVTFFNLQSIVNPFIVSLRLSFIRKAIKEKICKVASCWND